MLAYCLWCWKIQHFFIKMPQWQKKGSHVTENGKSLLMLCAHSTLIINVWSSRFIRLMYVYFFYWLVLYIACSQKISGSCVCLWALISALFIWLLNNLIDFNKKPAVSLSWYVSVRQDKEHLLTEVGSKERELCKKQSEQQQLTEQVALLESRLLSGGKNIIDHTNEQQRELELQRAKLADQKVSSNVVVLLSECWLCLS